MVTENPFRFLNGEEIHGLGVFDFPEEIPSGAAPCNNGRFPVLRLFLIRLALLLIKRNTVYKIDNSVLCVEKTCSCPRKALSTGILSGRLPLRAPMAVSGYPMLSSANKRRRSWSGPSGGSFSPSARFFIAAPGISTSGSRATDCQNIVPLPRRHGPAGSFFHVISEVHRCRTFAFTTRSGGIFSGAGS